MPAAFGEDGRNCWNITAPADGNVWPTAVPENEVVRFWCDDGYGRIGYAQYGCYGGQLVGTPTCQYAGMWALFSLWECVTFHYMGMCALFRLCARLVVATPICQYASICARFHAVPAPGP